MSKREIHLSTGDFSGAVQEVQRNLEAAKRAYEAQQNQNQNQTEKTMTVSLFKSTASGKMEVVVQTNAQSLDLFIVGLADATSAAMQNATEKEKHQLLESIFKNAFPLAFAIAGYKAEKVFETRMLVCGAVAADQSSLLAHSKT